MNLPILDITEIKKNKSFVAEKAKYTAKKKFLPNAPVPQLKYQIFLKIKSKKIIKKSDKIYIHVATFYSLNTANF